MTTIALRRKRPSVVATLFPYSVIQVEVINVVEGDVRKSHSAASAVLKIDVFETYGDDFAHLLVAGVRVAGVEQALRVRRGGAR